MSELYGDLVGILEVAQEVASIVGREQVWENYTGYKTVDTQRGIYLLLATAAKEAGGCRSLVEYGFYSDAQELCKRAKFLTDKLARMSKFLSWLIEQCEETEVTMIELLGRSDMMPDRDKAWIEDYRNPLGTRTEVGFLMFDGNVGEADVYAGELCLFREKVITTRRDNEGRRVSNTDADIKVGCVALGAGGRTGRTWGDLNMGPYDTSRSVDTIRENMEFNRIPRTNESGPNSDGVIMNVTAVSMEVGGDVGPYNNIKINGSYGKGITLMHTENEDGSRSVSLGAGKSPVGGTSTHYVGDGLTHEQRVAQRAAEAEQKRAEARREREEAERERAVFNATMTRPTSKGDGAEHANDPKWRAYWGNTGPKPWN